MNKRILYIVGGVCGIGILGFLYYAISPFFINIKVDEALPIEIPTETPRGTSSEVSEEEGMQVIQEEVTSKVEVVAEPARVSVVDTLAHPASGFVRIVEAGEKTYIRYEDYKTINGPDIYVYLAKDLDAKDFVDLGKVKATEGNINYEIPEGTNLSDYKYVLTWCKAFGVLFNSADLTPLH